METTGYGSRRHLSLLPPSPSPSPSPRLIQSRSGRSPAAMVSTLPEKNNSSRLSSSQRFITGNRSKSSTKSRPKDYNDEENVYPSMRSPSCNNNIGPTKRATSVTRSQTPSAWALSPQRFLGSPAGGPQLTAKLKSGGGGSGGAVSKVLKYFKQKKVSSLQVEEHHRLRILHNRLLQWRFVNARAEATMSTVKKVAEIKLFSVWLRIFIFRNTIVEKQIEMQNLRHGIKLYQIIKPQVSLLNEWEKLERRNEESVGRLARKLSALSLRHPLVEGAKANVVSVYQAMNTAMRVMDNIEEVITVHIGQVEKTLYQLTEFKAILKQEEEYLAQLQNIRPLVAMLVEHEKNTRVHLIQTVTELRRDQDC
ncbi:QWRF motif-containing protein [Quillaja saponaria]|uniref:QWRF motif-containing protein n=1 Tax=Quillaja saponaria TaxID=32244 RepID=A0AAD7PBK2_QUISA|nr:QWRF motif-containing protein [Quillaja saponaria]